jgi:hypothetical protein
VQACERAPQPSEFFPDAVLADTGTKLAFSYHTCGNVNRFTDTTHTYHKTLASFSDGSMRIAFPPTEWAYVLTNAIGNPDGLINVGKGRTMKESGKSGAVVEFFDKLMQDFGVDRYEVVPISAASKVYSNSSYTQCTVRVFRHKFTLEDAIRSHACSLKANMRVTNGIPLGSPLLLPLPP